jgi:hypothetical protein
MGCGPLAGGTARRLVLAGAMTATVLVAVPAAALAHIERTAYWPDPAPDTSLTPAAGGGVPTERSLASAVQRGGTGQTRVVCRPNSMRLLDAAITRARQKGITLRPSQKPEPFSYAQGHALGNINQKLFARCAYHQIQPAINDSHNNDRVVIMPGVYTEPASRAVPAFPPECEQYRGTSDHGSGALSYAYQFHCPNAQALVAVIGRALGPGQDPETSPLGRPDPHGIPNEGPCIRCNLQIEGSGPSPDDVVVDAGRVESGNAGPIGARKDVALKIDRADGAVVRNMTLRHAAEHDVYILETDGYLADRMKFFYAGEYGELMFTSDHGLTQDCEAAGSGDSGIYPGGAPDTGTQRDTRFYPDQRLNQTVTRCDLHHNNMGTSGTMGNSVHYIDNDIYDNASGFATDSFYAGGHPGFPEDSTVYERNRVYSNNFNVYAPDSDVESITAVPIGVGALIAGGDDNIVRNNYIYDNWRRGTMLLAVPDVIACSPSQDQGAPPCSPQGVSSTSNGNRYYDNIMGRAPDGSVRPNGVDFWWDEFPGNTGNCWYPNTGGDGTSKSITADPSPPPVEGTTVPGFLPEDCGSPANVGAGDPAKEAMLADCAQNGNDRICEWYQMPSKPGSQEAARQQAESREAGQRLVAAAAKGPFCQLLGGAGGTLTCERFRARV